MLRGQLVGVAPAHQGGARRPAARGVVKFGEAEATGSEGIEVWRVDLTPEAPEIREAHVIGQDHDDVGALPGEAESDPAQENECDQSG